MEIVPPYIERCLSGIDTAFKFSAPFYRPEAVLYIVLPSHRYIRIKKQISPVQSGRDQLL